MRILTASLIGLCLMLCAPLGAAEKKAAPAKAKTTSTAKAPTRAKTSAKAKTTAKAKTATKKPVSQQHPTTERYTEIQQALVDRGYLSTATGNWGTESVAALKKFQEAQGLPMDGKLGALSLTALGLGPRRGGTVEDAITAGLLPLGSAPTPLD